MPTKKDIEAVLDTIPDPEIGISIFQLGLIYNIDIDATGNVRVLMTLTTIGCPLFDQIKDPIVEKVMALKGVTNIDVELTFEPAWTPDTMSESAKLELGFA
jgi:metal-sulfur cluster biosynthetic enzyme